MQFYKTFAGMKTMERQINRNSNIQRAESSLLK